MPFTVAHPVAAVPLASVLGRHAVVSALVIGSITPDLAYFLPIYIPRWQSHNLPAIFWFCLPVGLATWAFFYACIAPLIHDLSPSRVRTRLPHTWAQGTLPPVRFVDVALCLAVGAVTHLIWDSFTHTGSPFIQSFPLLGRSFTRVGGYAVMPVNVLQHASTLFGFAVLATWGRRWLAGTPGPEVDPATHAFIRVLLLAVVLGPGAWVAVDSIASHWPLGKGVLVRLREALKIVVFVAGPVWCFTLVVVSLGWRSVRTSPTGSPAAVQTAVVADEPGTPT